MRLLPALALLLLVAPLTAAAQENTIHGCIKKNGTLKIVSVPANCSQGEIPISWNQTGPVGPEGPQGPPGPEGPQGPPGAALSVFDADGAEIGLLVSMENSRTHFVVYFTTVDAIGLIQRAFGIFQSSPHLVDFAEEGCMGQPFFASYPVNNGTIIAHFTRVSHTVQDERLFVGENALPSSVEVRSYLEGIVCTDYANPQMASLVPATEVTRSDLGIPETLAVPLWIGLSP